MCHIMVKAGGGGGGGGGIIVMSIYVSSVINISIIRRK